MVFGILRIHPYKGYGGPDLAFAVKHFSSKIGAKKSEIFGAKCLSVKKVLRLKTSLGKVFDISKSTLHFNLTIV